jgi:hypothetical protein
MSCDAVRPCHALLCSSVQCGAVLLGGEGESVPTVRGGQGQLHHHHIGHGEAHRCRRRGREEGGERLRVGSQLRAGGPVAGGLIISVAALYIHIPCVRLVFFISYEGKIIQGVFITMDMIYSTAIKNE